MSDAAAPLGSAGAGAVIGAAVAGPLGAAVGGVIGAVSGGGAVVAYKNDKCTVQ